MNKKSFDLPLIDKLIDIALEEDIYSGDITTENLIPEGESGKAKITAKQNGIISGIGIAEKVFKKLDVSLIWNPLKSDGDAVIEGETVIEFEGKLRALLTGERTALNFMQRMSGVASLTSLYVKELEAAKTKLLDTRKTIPGMRLLDKYAVLSGGGVNHRMGLFDMVMIKDNHIKAAGSITNAVVMIRPKIKKSIKIEVETTDLDEVREAIEAGADIIMLDNMKTEMMHKAVNLINGKAKTEASGNVTLERLKEIAAAGVDYISTGAVTHSAKTLDLSQYIL